MRVVYIDSLFVLNFVINYLLLLASVKIAGVAFSRLRLAAGAALGAGYAVAVWLPGLGFLAAWPFKLLSGALLVFAACFGYGRFFRVTLIFTGVSSALAGSVLAVGLLAFGSAPPGGILYFPIDVKTLLLATGLSYALLTIVFKGAARHLGGETLNVVLTLQNRRLELNALLDTGHTLTDPMTGVPVLIAEASALKSLLGFLPDNELLAHPADALEALSCLGIPFRLLPYRAIGVDCGFLLAFKPDSVTIDKKKKSMLVALSPTAVSEGVGFQALVGSL